MAQDRDIQFADLSPAQRSELERRLQGNVAASRRIPRASRTEPLALSFAQEQMWMQQMLNPLSVACNRPTNFRLRGPLQVPALRRALQLLVDRHESLRTTVSIEDDAPRLIPHEECLLTVPVSDLSGEPDPLREALRVADNEARRPLSLDECPLLRVQLLRLGPDDHLLLLTVHHFAFDAWSQNVLLDDLTSAYESLAGGNRWQPVANEIEYADFAQWDRSDERIADRAKGRQWWKDALTDPPTLELPADLPHPARQDATADHLPLVLPGKIVSALRDLARSEQTTMFVVLLSAFQTLLSRYSGQDDIVVGCPVAGRSRIETEKMIGMFINTLPFRADLSDSSFRSLLRQVRETTMAGLRQQDVPLQHIVQDVATARDPMSTPLFRVNFVYENFAARSACAAGTHFEPCGPGGGGTFVDLSLDLGEADSRISGQLTWRRSIWSRAMIERMSKHFVTLLWGIVENPDCLLSRLPLLTTHERRLMLEEWGRGNVVPLPGGTVVDAISDRAAQTPDACAIECSVEQRSLSYRDLDGISNQLARRLRTLGIGGGDRVGVVAERSIESVVALLGVMKSGAAFVPLDIDLPARRLGRIVADCTPRLTLCRAKLAARAAVCGRVEVFDIDACGELPRTPLHAATVADEPAYVLYTSGSTGVPNGVIVEHRALLNYCHATVRSYDLTEADRMLQFSSLSFDGSLDEIFPSLLTGGAIVLRSDEMIQSAHRFFQGCEVLGITAISTATAFWHQLCAETSTNHQPMPECLRLLAIGGEAADTSHLKSWLEQYKDRPQLINGYGPTEATVACTVADLTADTGRCRESVHVSIGRPIDNLQVYILDAAGNPQPAEIPGELHVAGAGLARGYLNRERLTASKFIANPFGEGPNARMYRTGDLCRWSADGQIEYLGRIDHQVKLRGFRVELGEIESTLNSHEDVSQNVVVMREDRRGEQQLVAYWVPGPEPRPNPASLADYLRERLPAYMVPTAFVAMDALPRTERHKIDRRALPPPPEPSPAAREARVGADSPISRQLTEIWCDVLDLETVNVDDNFFEVGGNSLLAVRLFGRLEECFGTDLALTTIFEFPTIAELTKVLDSAV